MSKTNETSASRSKWDPVAAPFRVVATYNAPPPLYWRSAVRTFATLPEAQDCAREYAAKRLYHSVRIDYAANAHDWQRRGKWTLVERPKHKGKRA